LAPHVSRTDDKGAGASPDETAEGKAYEPEPEGISGAANVCSVGSSDAPVLTTQSAGGCAVGDESERSRLIATIMRLMGEPTMPECTRTAGLTLIGWLARRRPDEPPHAIGVDEARESERRVRAARSKTR
jgi:hypothetical protein